MKKILLSVFMLSVLVLGLGMASAVTYPTTTYGPTGPNYAYCDLDHETDFVCTAQVEADDNSYVSIDSEEEIQNKWTWSSSGIPSDATVTNVKVRVLGMETNPNIEANIQIWSSDTDSSLTGYQSFPWNDWETLIFESTNLNNYVQGKISSEENIKLEIDFEEGEWSWIYGDEVLIDYVSLEITYYVADTDAPVITNMFSDEEYPTCEDVETEVCVNVTDASDISSVMVSCWAGQSSGTQAMFLDTSKGDNIYCSEPDFSTSTFGAIDGKDVKCTVTAEDEYGYFDTLTENPLWTYDCKGPTAVISGSLECDEGTTLTLSGADSYDSNDVTPADELIYSWTGVTTSTGDSATVKCVDDGTIDVSLIVEDHAGHVSQTTTETVNVLNVDPVASISGATSAEEGSNTTLTASETDDGVLDTHTFAWDLNDDGIFDDATGTEISVHCVDEELIEVEVQVTDDDMGTDTETHFVQCQNVAPIVDAGQDQTVNQNQEVTIEPTYSDVGVNDELTIEVSWDGVNFVEDDFTHTYCVVEDHTVIVKVTDGEGGETTDTLTVTVNNVAPEITSTGEPYRGVVNEVLTFTATGSDVCGDLLEFQWNFGEGYSTTDTNSWPEKFSGLISLKVIDEYGGEDETTVQVDIYEYGIQLNAGWNLISIPVMPTETGIDSVFATILDYVAYEGENTATVLQYDATTDKWSKSRPNSDKTGFEWNTASSELTTVVPGYGYWIKMDSDAILYGNEAEFNQQQKPTPSIDVASQSWNLVGKYELGNTMSASDAFVSLEGQFFETSLTGYNRNTESLEYRTELATGEGYWIYTKNFADDEETWSYSPIDYTVY